MNRSLASLLREHAVESGDYAGVSTPTAFGAPETEWRALTEGAAVLDLSRRRSIVARGEERAQFLHGQLSQDVLSVQPGQGRPALLLSAQGRVESMLAVYVHEESIELRVDEHLLPATQARLDRFLIADDVEFETIVPSERSAMSTGSECLAVAGPKTSAVLGALGIVADRPGSWCANAHTADVDVRIYSREDLRVPFVEIEPTGHSDDVWTALCEAGAVPVGTRAFDVVRIESGTPLYGVDVDDSRIAMEARLEWSIHFAKGCYVGQEVIERAVSRGRLHRELCLLRTEAEVRRADRIDGGSDKEVVTSVGQSPALGAICLAYLPVASSAAGSAVRISSGGRSVDARVLDWPRPRRLAGR